MKPEIMSFQTLISIAEALNLDDGVKANYLKFPALLAKIPGAGEEGGTMKRGFCTTL